MTRCTCVAALRSAVMGTVLTGTALGGTVLLMTGSAFAQAPPATPSGTKLISPVRGQAEIGFTQPVTKREGGMIVTTIKIKNLSSAPIAGLKVDEFWYDKAGDPVTGAQPFRYRKPLMPGEVIDVVLKVPTNPKMSSNQYKFEHANGTIKPTKMPKL